MTHGVIKSSKRYKCDKCNRSMSKKEYERHHICHICRYKSTVEVLLEEAENVKDVRYEKVQGIPNSILHGLASLILLLSIVSLVVAMK